MEVEAYVVDMEDAAFADDAGLLNPLLHCFQRNIFNVNVWALPAVEVRGVPSCPHIMHVLMAARK